MKHLLHHHEDKQVIENNELMNELNIFTLSLFFIFIFQLHAFDENNSGAVCSKINKLQHKQTLFCMIVTLIIH